MVKKKFKGWGRVWVFGKLHIMLFWGRENQPPNKRKTNDPVTKNPFQNLKVKAPRPVQRRLRVIQKTWHPSDGNEGQWAEPGQDGWAMGVEWQIEIEKFEVLAGLKGQNFLKNK